MCKVINDAPLYLGKIPEAESELNVYKWWWGTLGRQDLSIKAFRLSSYIGNKVDLR